MVIRSVTLLRNAMPPAKPCVTLLRNRATARLSRIQGSATLRSSVVLRASIMLRRGGLFYRTGCCEPVAAQCCFKYAYRI